MSDTNATWKTKLITGGYKFPVEITRKQGRLWFKFDNNVPLQAEVKAMSGSRYHGYDDEPIKQWSITDNIRNRFQLQVLEGKNPYGRYDKPLIEFKPKRNLWSHQILGVQHNITRQYGINAFEMSTGKSLVAIETMEWLCEYKNIRSWFYCAPKSALISVQEEFDHWKALVRPQFFTYEGLKSVLEHWPEDADPPQGLICDEGSRLKNPTAQRSANVQYLADQIRERWGDNGAVIVMTGTPAPKGPTDWWSISEICCPGFLREGDLGKFRNRLAIMAKGQTEAGGIFPKLISWKDDANKCNICGKLEKEYEHDVTNILRHDFIKSVNEVELLHRRLGGLVVTAFKKDVQKDLPDKIFKIIRCKPSIELINAAKLITARGESSIKTLTLLRELSDGFQYDEKDCGTEICPLCKGVKTRLESKYIGPDEEYERIQDLMFTGQDIPSGMFEEMIMPCSYCDGVGESTKYMREALQIPCPKEEALKDIIDIHEDIGRLVCYASFTGSIDRCVEIFVRTGWDVISCDSRGWRGFGLSGKAADLYKMFKRDMSKRIAFVANAQSGGLGLNLQQSPSIVYYSNDFNAESRMQSIERTHRPGMDVNRGCTIYDIFNLPTDELILNNLNTKKKLQSVTMGDIRKSLEI